MRKHSGQISSVLLLLQLPALEQQQRGGSAPHVGRDQQPLHHLPILEVRIDDFIDVAFIHVGIPDRLRIHHGNRAGGTTIQATGLVDPDLARTGKTGRLDTLLAAVEAGLSSMLGTTGLTILALVQAKENMPLEIRGWRKLCCRDWIRHPGILVFPVHAPDML